MKVGDYVRTKYGIAKIIDLKDNPYGEKTIYILNKSIINIYDCDGGELACCNPFIEDMQNRFDTKFGDEKCIIKSSPNIIDLIEVGDILYLEESDDIACMFFKDIYLVKNEDNLLNIISDIKNKKCKLISIVTKQQFESMEYKVGD
jgi:hypothetical protein